MANFIIINKYKDKSLENTEQNRRKALEELYTSSIEKLNTHDFDEDLGISQLYVLDEIVYAHEFFLTVRFKKEVLTEELSDCFSVFMALCKEVNKHIAFVPTVSTFCNFMAISKQTFNNILVENSERGEIAKFINETLSDRYMQAMLSNKLPAIPAIFVAKANFGMRDNETANYIPTFDEKPKTLQEIMKEFKKDFDFR